MSGSIDEPKGVENIDTVDLEVDDDTIEGDLDADEDDCIMSDLIIEELSPESSFSMKNKEPNTIELDDNENVKEVSNDNYIKGDAAENKSGDKYADCEMEAEEDVHMETESTKDEEASVEKVQQEQLVATSSGDAKKSTSSGNGTKISKNKTNDSSQKTPLTEEILKGILNVKTKDDNAIKKAETTLVSILGSCATHDVELLMSVREKDDKMAKETVAIILKTLNCVLRSKLLNIEEITIRKLIKFALKELTKSSKTEPAIQNPALDVLVTIGKEKYLEMIMEELAAHTKTEALPHFMILHCLGKLIIANLLGMVAFMKTLLTTLLLPVAVDTKSLVLKKAQNYATRCLCEALANFSQPATPAESDTVIGGQKPVRTYHLIAGFEEEVYSTYNLLYSQWLHSREPQICVDILETLSKLGRLLIKVESRTKTCGSARKRMGILLKLGVGVDEAKDLAKRPMAELEYLYAPNKGQPWHPPLCAGKNVYKNTVAKANTTIQPNKEATNNNSRGFNPGNVANIYGGSNHLAINGNIKRLSGAGKKRLNILLRQGMDMETARIKAMEPLSHWNLTPAERMRKIMQIRKDGGKKKTSRV